MSRYGWTFCGAVLGAVGVAAGAFGAHALGDHPQIATFDVAVRYQMYHALAMLAVGQTTGRCAQVAGWFFACGVVLFSGMLYLRVLGAGIWSVHVVPVGGTLLIAGWVALACAAAARATSSPGGTLEDVAGA